MTVPAPPSKPVLRLEGGRLLPLPPSVPPASLAGLVAGSLRAFYFQAPSGELEEIEAFCSGLRLACLPVDRPSRFPAPGPANWVFVGRGPAELRRVARRWAGRHVAFGKSLGMPPCCVDAFRRWKRLPRRHRDWPDPLSGALERTKSEPPFDFTMNTLLDPHSRLREKAGVPEEGRRRDRLLAAAGLHAHVLPWHPCRYDCPASLRAGRRIWVFLSEYLPGTARWLRSLLEGDVLHLGGLELAVVRLRGTASSGGRLAGPPRLSTLRPAAARLLAAGDSIAAVEDGLEVRRRGTLVGKLGGPGARLLRFRGARAGRVAARNAKA